MPDDSSSAADRIVEHSSCLGCGCTCNDITVVVRGGRIAETRQACSLGRQWFGTGELPARIRMSGASGDSTGDIRSVLASAALLLQHSRRPLVYLSTDLSSEAQRAAIGVADVLGAMIDTITSATAAPSIITGQRRGSVTATLGEIRNRADAIVFWGTDPATRYPRFSSRYAPDPIGLYVEHGRRGRTVTAVDIGADRGPTDADVRTAFAPEEEVMALGLMRAALLGRGAPHAASASLAGRAGELVQRLAAAKYVAIVSDGESTEGREVWRSEALARLVEALNDATRCALVTLRGGGNRSGADAALTSQTGYPMTVDFSRGAPAYNPDDSAAPLLARDEVDTALVVGSPHGVPEALHAGLGRTTCIAIGPRASESPFTTTCAIDTGVAGIHEGGSATRMDGIPLPLRPSLDDPSVAALLARHGTDLAVADRLAELRRPQDTHMLLRALASLVLRAHPSGGQGHAR